MSFVTDLFKRRRVSKAAEEMWTVVRRGIAFEVPFSKDPHDLSQLAVVELCRRHPEVKLKVHQSRGMVISLHEAGQPHAKKPISGEAWGLLDRGGYRGPTDEKVKQVRIEEHIDDHIRWMQSQGLNPEVQEREAQEADQRKHALGNFKSSSMRLQEEADRVLAEVQAEVQAEAQAPATPPATTPDKTVP